jgi:hypothetical protein
MSVTLMAVAVVAAVNCSVIMRNRFVPGLRFRPKTRFKNQRGSRSSASGPLFASPWAF